MRFDATPPPDVMADDDAQRYLCSYCYCDITLRLKCAVCQDFDLCLQCYAAGASIGRHKSTHPYQLIDEGSFPLLVQNWGAIEEVLLLDAVEQDGFGNWEDIAAHVVTKTARECKEHYSENYIRGVIGEGCIPKDHHATVLQGHGGEVPVSPPHFTPVKLEHAEQLELGYMPLRDDFEREHDNGAEASISGIMVAAEDEEVEEALKLAHIDMYNHRLKQREGRKRIAKIHNLIAGKQRACALKRKYPKEERDWRAKFEQLARLTEGEQYQHLIGSLKKQQQVQQQIKQLIQYRKNGVNKQEEFNEFDILKQEHARIESEGEASAFFEASTDPEVIIPSGMELLNVSERKICNALSLTPKDYLAIKIDTMKSSSLKKAGYAVKAKLPKHLSSEQRSKLNQYFSRVGWLG